MAYTNIGNLTLLEETMAHHVPRPLGLRVREQSNRRINVRQVMFGLSDLRLIHSDPSVDIGALVFERLYDQRFCHDREHPRTSI